MQKISTKIARRIEFASIYPPNALDKMQAAIVKFDNAQKEEQGGLRLIDIFFISCRNYCC